MYKYTDDELVKICSTFKSYYKNRDEYDDFIQDCRIRAYEKRHMITKRGYLFKLVVNLHNDKMRRRTLEQKHTININQYLYINEATNQELENFEFPDESVDIEKEYQLFKLFDSLPKKLKIIVFHRMRGMTLEDMAKEIGWNPAKLKTFYYRLRQKFFSKNLDK